MSLSKPPLGRQTIATHLPSNVQGSSQYTHNAIAQPQHPISFEISKPVPVTCPKCENVDSKAITFNFSNGDQPYGPFCGICLCKILTDMGLKMLTEKEMAEYKYNKILKDNDEK